MPLKMIDDSNTLTVTDESNSCLKIISNWLEYLKPYYCLQIIYIKNSYLKL